MLRLCSVQDLPPLPELERLVSPSRLERARRILDPAARLRLLGAGWLLRQEFGDREPSLTEHGKPYFPEGPHFSLSHSGDLLGLLVADAPCGLDIERSGASRDYLSIARHAFHPDTAAALAALPPSELPEAFAREWTLLEAWLKARGTGFSENYLRPRFSSGNPPELLGPGAPSAPAFTTEFRECRGVRYAVSACRI